MIYRIQQSETAESEINDAFFWLAGRSPEFAGRWLDGLLDAIQGLDVFPERYPVAPENDLFPTTTVRQLIYRTGRMAYRVLYCLIDEDGDEIDETVLILHVRHGSKRRLGEMDRC